MTNSFLFEQIKAKASFLCVGLDIDLDKIPSHLLQEEDPIFAFAKAIIDATHKYSVAYKPNLAFFESYKIFLSQFLAHLQISFCINLYGSLTKLSIFH